MKKLLAALLCLACLLPGAAWAEEDPEDRLLAQWMDFLTAIECEAEEMLWVTEACGAFLEEPSWEKLIYARAVANTAGNRFMERTPPQEQLTGEDYVALLMEGKDLLFVSEEMQGYADSRAYNPNPVAALEGYAEFDLLWRICHRGIGQELEALRGIALTNVEYYALETNYLLLCLGDDARTEAFLSQLELRCPRIFDALEFSSDAAAVEQAADDALERYEALLDMQEEGGDLAYAGLELYTQAMIDQDWDFLEEQAVALEISLMPFLYPDWFDHAARAAEWTWADESGNPADPLENPSARPVRCRMTIPGVTREQLLEYGDTMESIGLSARRVEETENTCALIYAAAGGEVIFGWVDGAATIELPADGAALVRLQYLLAIL